MKSKRKKIDVENEYIRINKAINREIELERNGGRWKAVNRPHKNKKKYVRKRDRRIDSNGLFLYSYSVSNSVASKKSSSFI